MTVIYRSCTNASRRNIVIIDHVRTRRVMQFGRHSITKVESAYTHVGKNEIIVFHNNYLFWIFRVQHRKFGNEIVSNR